MKKRTVSGAVYALVFAVICAFASSARADTIQFVRQSANASENVASQLTVDLSFTSTGGTTTAHFRFLNNVGTAASITDIYFNDDFDTVFEFSNPEPVITDSGSGVSFSDGARPRNPPGSFGSGWNTLSFSLDSDSPVSSNGVDSSSEWLQVDFELLSGVSEADVRSVVDTTGVTSAVLALHVQAIGSDGESDWFFNEGVVPVPEPASIALLGIGLGAALAVNRRRRLLVRTD